MSDFMKFKTAIKNKLDLMSTTELFRVDVDKDTLWETYLSSFPDDTNPMYKERTEHDCQCCKQFIRSAGGIVIIEENELMSIWDINIGGHFQVVSDALSDLVKQYNIKDYFLHFENSLGTDHNHQQLEDGDVKKWEHFHYALPSKYVKRNMAIGTTLSDIRSNKEVFKRGLESISFDAINTVLELIEQNSIYRGAENKSIIELFLEIKKEYDGLEDKHKDNFCWIASKKIGSASKIRNSSIGTLLVDLSEGKSLNASVSSFESKVAPTNYKRPSALITKSMINNAQKKVKELGIEESLKRRYAVIEDITVNNVLFADRIARRSMDVFDEMTEEVPDKIDKWAKVDEVTISAFVKDILPKANNIELLLENRHNNNLMSLIAPIDVEAKQIFKWHNNYSWNYNGEVADSMKERVKRAGGRVDGVLRFSIQWNDGDNNQNDFDAHCIEPDGNLISYPVKTIVQRSSGVLDIDIVNPGNSIAVENITWSDIDKMQSGTYKFLVHNYSHNGGKTGFTAEIEYNGEQYSYTYDKELRQDEKVVVAKIKFSKNTGIKFIESLPSSQASKEIWNISTQKFHRVSMIMNSPNHWDGKKTGNKHLFFILDGCKNDKKSRGFFNEFLKEELTEHRKVFEVLGSKMKTEESENQLSGLGFSSTQKNHVLCKVTGSFNRTIKINF